jgi:hypothetical protein
MSKNLSDILKIVNPTLPAFSQANTALSIGQSAFSQANVAYNTANSAFSQANTALSIGQSAFSQANAKYSTGSALGTPTSANLINCTADGIDSVGFRNIPINSQSAAYQTVITDSGKCIFHPSTDANVRTFTIPANTSVSYPLGTAISFVNMTSQVVSIAITTDTLYLAGTGTTGTRSLAQYGSATALKLTWTTWIISGAGLT